MSDFDKEAEREKLREKFERDREKRQQSERMSELLLKGATMTNKHHDCGSPIFRWNGEEFCPSCEGADGVGGADAGATDAGPDGETAGGADTAAGSPGGAGDEPVDAASEAVDETADAPAEAVDEAADATRVADATDGADATEIDVTAEPTADDGTEPATRRPTGDPSRAPTGERTAGSGAAGEGVAAARASLERTLAAVAREAEETPTTDLSRKRNLVAAAREAAEALEAARRAGRQ
jgi:uncharacterized Zn finger protein (UPF0148 family)